MHFPLQSHAEQLEGQHILFVRKYPGRHKLQEVPELQLIQLVLQGLQVLLTVRYVPSIQVVQFSIFLQVVHS